MRRFYLEVRPNLNIEAPKGYYWDCDEERYRAIVIIEDVATTKGATFCDWRSTINRAEAEDAIRLLANFHAPYYADKGLRDKYPWIRTYEQWSNSYFDMKEEHLKAMVEARDVIPQSLHDKGDRIYDLFMPTRIHNPNADNTGIHSDVHLGN